jgi:Fic family protein
MPYNHQHKNWPVFTWDHDQLVDLLAAVRYRQGKLIGRMESLGFSLREEAMLQTLTQDVLKSSEIEGELLNPDQVRSSIARRLGIEIAGSVSSDRNVDGVVEMMLDATQSYNKPLTEDRLFGWHAALFPTGRSGMFKITVGAWRDGAKGPMQVVSGPMGRKTIHYEAPDAESLPMEMAGFLNWINDKQDTDPVLKAAVAHLWFVTIHPFDDGNGRIARAIADMQLSRADESTQRFYSMSAQIRLERKEYYHVLESTQKGNLDITEWLQWFLRCLDGAISATEEILGGVMRKARFWDKFPEASFNVRQQKILNKLIDGIEGKITSSKWARMANCSQDTAARDIHDLIGRGVLVKEAAGGRSTSYLLSEEANA